MATAVMSQLPVLSALPAIKQALANHPVSLLVAPPGSGKTTAVPPALLEESWLAGKKILLLEPRRLAARSVASYMAKQYGETLGETIGYQVRLEKKISAKTRIEVITEGLLTRRLQADPELADTGLIIFDEFHERNLQTDLGLALALDVVTSLRDDLRLLIMSATLDTQQLTQGLTARIGDVPIVQAEGRSFPVDVIHPPLLTQKGKPSRAGYHFHDCIAVCSRAVQLALQEQSGDLLVFLPGSGEINALTRALNDWQNSGSADSAANELLICPLHGQLDKTAQQRAITPQPGKRRAVLATSLAETSLTIGGISTVIDSGWSRLPAFDPNTALTALQTCRVSQSSATQRAGRAGRLGPGLAYRLWPQSETLAKQHPAEIQQADLAPLLLEIAAWGAKPIELFWLEELPTAAIAQAQSLLQSLNGLDAHGRITAHGRKLIALAAHPRIGHMLLQANELGQAKLACQLAAIISERDPAKRELNSADIHPRLQAMNQSSKHNSATANMDSAALRWANKAAEQWQHRLKQQARSATQKTQQQADLSLAGVCLAWAYPDRIAQQRQANSGQYQLSNARGAQLADDDALTQTPYLVAAQLSRSNQQTSDRIRLAAEISMSQLQTFHANLFNELEHCAWDDGKGRVLAEQRQSLAALIISRKPIKNLSAAQQLAGLLAGIKQQGLNCLPWTQSSTELRERIAFLHEQAPADWPAVSNVALLATLDEWLAPYLSGWHRLDQLQQLNLTELLNNYLGWERLPELAALAPSHISIPSGRKARIDYSQQPPVLAVKLQEMFGATGTPKVYNGSIALQLHLLSPAGKPLQLTQDLASFWQNAYSDVRKDMKGRYPKHPWPEDPLSAKATRHVKAKQHLAG